MNQSDNKKTAITEMSHTKSEEIEDIATEDEMIDRTVRRFANMNSDIDRNPLTDQTPHNKYPTTEDAGQNSPDNRGEQDALGGSASDNETDDDIDEMNLRTFGETPEDTDEIPNLADQIDRGEKAFHDS